MCNLTTGLRVKVIAILALSMLMCAAIQAAPKARVMIVLDASGSMMGKIGDVDKMTIARKALSDLMNEWDPEVEVGLMAYGHRRKGDCADIEVVVPVGTPDKQAILDAADKLTPLGKTPLSDATIKAADALKFSEETATVILISDGEETCDKNPCDVGTELEGKGINFTAHVIGFDVSDPAHQAQLRCLAENTGGKYLNAQSAGELKSALSEVVEQVKSADSVAPPKTDKLTVQAVFKENGEAVKRDIRFDIYEDKAGSEELGTALATGYDPVYTAEIPEGNYIVEASANIAKAQVSWDTAKDKQLTINLNAGVVQPVARASEDGETLKDVTWSLYSDQDAKTSIFTSYEDAPSLVITAGTYILTAKFGDAEGKTSFTVEAGTALKPVVDLSTGIVKPVVVYSGQEEVTHNTAWTVYSAEKDLEGKRESVTTSYDKKPTFKLNAGNYVLQIVCGSATAETPIEVKANEAIAPTLDLNAGILSLKPKVSSERRFWSISEAKANLSGERKKITSSYDETTIVVLPAGKYFVTLEQLDKTGEQEVEVIAGEKLDVELEVK